MALFGIGWRRYLQRYQGALAFRYDAHQISFDHQKITISLLSLEYGDNEVQLAMDEESTGRKTEPFNVTGMDYPERGTDYNSYHCSRGQVTKGDSLRDLIDKCGEPISNHGKDGGSSGLQARVVLEAIRSIRFRSH